MTSLGASFMGLDPHKPSGRLAIFLRRTLGDANQTKRLASAIDCTPKAAENILSGSWPCARHWASLVETFGRDVTDAVFHPDEAARRLEQEVRDLEHQLASRRAALREVAGSVPGRPKALAPVLDRPAVSHSWAAPTSPSASSQDHDQ